MNSTPAFRKIVIGDFVQWNSLSDPGEIGFVVEDVDDHPLGPCFRVLWPTRGLTLQHHSDLAIVSEHE
jgi:hypothetical protein